MRSTPANNLPFITSAEAKTFSAPRNTRNSELQNSSGTALLPYAVYAIPISSPDARDKKMISRSGLHGWKEKRSRLLRHGAGVFRRLRSQRPVERFGESIEELARSAFHGHATFAKTEQEHAAIRRIE